MWGVIHPLPIKSTKRKKRKKKGKGRRKKSGMEKAKEGGGLIGVFCDVY